MSRNKKLRFISLCSILILTFLFSGVSHGQEVPSIRVGLWANQQNIVISSNTSFQALNENGEVLGRFSNKEKAAFSLQGTQILLNGKSITAKNVEFRMTDDSSDAYMEVNKRSYRGMISIHKTIDKAGLTVVNTLPVEQYLYGVVAREISPEWALEAVKAQAVAARTYALFSINKHNADGFDVCSTTDCQVYDGRESESERTKKAVDDTRGIVLQYENKLISACFHSSGGGFTENSENVWSSPLPYLKGVVDYDQQSPYYKWKKEYTPQELSQLLTKAGYNVGDLQAIVLSRLSAPPVTAVDRGVSGRVKTIRFTGTNGSVMLTGTKLRGLLGLNSTLFDMSIVTPAPASIEVPITDSFGDHGTKKVEVNLKPSVEKGLINDKDIIRRITGRPQERIVINGSGFGHGLGLSQWGAKAMAEKAPQSDAAYFKTILKHYYQGVDVVKIY